MTMTDKRAPYWLDVTYDRENANTGTRSRYANYLRLNLPAFKEIYSDDPTVEFAATAWRIANGPIMAPGLVRSHARISSTSVQRSSWDGQLVAEVTLIVPTPAVLTQSRPTTSGWYRDYEYDSWTERYELPSEQDLARGNHYLLTESHLQWQLPEGHLPAIDPHLIEQVAEALAGEPNPETAALRSQAVTAVYQQAIKAVPTIAALLNREITPIINQIERN